MVLKDEKIVMQAGLLNRDRRVGPKCFVGVQIILVGSKYIYKNRTVQNDLDPIKINRTLTKRLHPSKTIWTVHDNFESTEGQGMNVLSLVFSLILWKKQ